MEAMNNSSSSMDSSEEEEVKTTIVSKKKESLKQNNKTKDEIKDESSSEDEEQKVVSETETSEDEEERVPLKKKEKVEIIKDETSSEEEEEASNITILKKESSSDEAIIKESSSEEEIVNKKVERKTNKKTVKKLKKRQSSSEDEVFQKENSEADEDETTNERALRITAKKPASKKSSTPKPQKTFKKEQEFPKLHKCYKEILREQAKSMEDIFKSKEEFTLIDLKKIVEKYWKIFCDSILSGFLNNVKDYETMLNRIENCKKLNNDLFKDNVKFKSTNQSEAIADDYENLQIGNTTVYVYNDRSETELFGLLINMWSMFIILLAYVKDIVKEDYPSIIKSLKPSETLNDMANYYSNYIYKETKCGKRFATDFCLLKISTNKGLPKTKKVKKEVTVESKKKKVNNVDEPSTSCHKEKKHKKKV